MEHGQGGHAGYHGDAYHAEHSYTGGYHDNAYHAEQSGHGGHWTGAPFGDLVGGLAAGHEYVLGHHNGVHVMHRGHFGGGRYGNEPFADDLALAIAIDLAVSHGGHLEGFHSGHLGAVPAFAGTAGGQHNTDQARTFNLPGIARDKYAIEVLVWPHGKCNPQAEIRQLATRAGMTRIHPGPIDGNADVDRLEMHLLSNTPFGDDDDPVNQPNGWYRDARGTTHVWREYFQLQPCNWGPLNFIFGDPNWDFWRTYLVASGVTWFYRNTGDYETRISFTVWSKGFVINKRWDWRWQEIYVHRDKAEVLAAGVLKYLQHYRAPELAIRRRAAMSPEQFLPKVKPQQPGLAPAGNGPVAFIPVDVANPGSDQFDTQQVEKPAW